MIQRKAKPNRVEKNMNVLDKLLGLALTEDLTETTWWTDTIFRGLEECSSTHQASVPEVEGATQQSGELT